MKFHEVDYYYSPTVIQSVFDWTFDLNADFAKGKHMAYQTTSAAVLLVLGIQLCNCVRQTVLTKSYEAKLEGHSQMECIIARNLGL